MGEAHRSSTSPKQKSKTPTPKGGVAFGSRDMFRLEIPRQDFGANSNSQNVKELIKTIKSKCNHVSTSLGTSRSLHLEHLKQDGAFPVK